MLLVIQLDNQVKLAQSENAHTHAVFVADEEEYFNDCWYQYRWADSKEEAEDIVKNSTLPEKYHLQIGEVVGRVEPLD